jgi:hypothetical protein
MSARGNTLRGRRSEVCSLMRCCAGDGGRPSVVALQGVIANHPRAAAVKSRGGKRRGRRRAFECVRCGSMKANESEPQVSCRKAFDDIKTGSWSSPRDKSGGCLFIGQMVSGMYAARARVRLLHGTWEPVVLRDRQLVVCDLRLVVSGKGSSGRNRERQIPVVGHRGGPSGSSDEGPVMGLERSGRAIQARSLVNHEVCGMS